MMEDQNGIDRKGKNMAGTEVGQAKGSESGDQAPGSSYDYLRPLGPNANHIPVMPKLNQVDKNGMDWNGLYPPESRSFIRSYR